MKLAGLCALTPFFMLKRLPYPYHSDFLTIARILEYALLWQIRTYNGIHRRKFHSKEVLVWLM